MSLSRLAAAALLGAAAVAGLVIAVDAGATPRVDRLRVEVLRGGTVIVSWRIQDGATVPPTDSTNCEPLWCVVVQRDHGLGWRTPWSCAPPLPSGASATIVVTPDVGDRPLGEGLLLTVLRSDGRALRRARIPARPRDGEVAGPEWPEPLEDLPPEPLPQTRVESWGRLKIRYSPAREPDSVATAEALPGRRLAPTRAPMPARRPGGREQAPGHAIRVR